MPVLSSIFMNSAEAGHGIAQVTAPGTVQWVLGNDGSVQWPEGTTLRLVSGPAVACPAMPVPLVEPGFTAVVEFEFAKCEATTEVWYSLATPAGEPFGELIHVVIQPAAPAKPEPVPLVALLSGPSATPEESAPIQASKGEVKMVEWHFANPGPVAWPEDATFNLIYNTEGWENLPHTLHLGALGAGETLHVVLAVPLPAFDQVVGHFKAAWVVASDSVESFGDIVFAEFQVCEEQEEKKVDDDASSQNSWVLADAMSEVSSVGGSGVTDKEQKGAARSIMVVGQQHHLLDEGEVSYDEWCCFPENEASVSLGCLRQGTAGGAWILELELKNNGTKMWGADTELRCCFGSGFGCPSVALPLVDAGESLLLQMDLTIPAGCDQTAWVMCEGDEVFGPALVLRAIDH